MVNDVGVSWQRLYECVTTDLHYLSCIDQIHCNGYQLCMNVSVIVSALINGIKKNLICKRDEMRCCLFARFKYL